MQSDPHRPCLISRAPVPRPSASLISVRIASDTDFLLARQRARHIAEMVGFEKQDQTRIATAVSEIARNAFEYAGGGRAEFFIDRAPVPQLRILISDDGPGIPHLDDIWSGTYHSSTGMGLGLVGARRLMDGFNLESSTSGTTATLIKRLPRSAPDPPSLAQLTASLAQASQSSARALTDQSHELLNLLNDLRARESELERLNGELEETNRGVLVLYAELEDHAHAVQHASEMKTRFLSGVTHELRTPLNSIVSLSRLLLQSVDGDLNPEQQKQVQFILRSAQNLSDMVNDLLDLARIEAGKTTTTLSTFTVADTLAALRGMFRPLAVNDHVDLIFEIPQQSISLHTDEGKLSQILRNFISNALKFTTAGSVIVSVEAAPAGHPTDSVLFSVTDTGTGIAPEHFETVMQEWGQVEGPAQKHKGSGLGLPLSRSLAQLLGGHIWFESTIGSQSFESKLGTESFESKLGSGSTFYLLLPALAEPQRALAEPQRAIQASLGLSTPIAEPAHILIADDDEVARYLLRRRLASLTTALIIEVTGGKDCLASIASDPPCILFLDLVMPGLSGADVARHLRSDPATEDLPIVLVTSKILGSDERAALEALCLTIISKRTGEDDPKDSEDREMQIERALLQVGLSNINQGPPTA
jgi:signal transduction histidine kinase